MTSTAHARVVRLAGFALLVGACAPKQTGPTTPPFNPDSQPADSQTAEEPAASPTTEAPTGDGSPDASADETVAAEDPQPAAEPAPRGPTTDDKVAKIAAGMATSSEAGALTARRQLEALLDEDPNAASAWFNLGVAEHRLGNLAAAADAFQRATRVDEDFAPAWRALGVVEQQLGDVDTALRRFERALSLDDEDMDTHVAQVRALREAGREQAAIDAAKAALRVNALDLRIYNLMGLAYLAIDEIPLARFVYEKASRIEGAEDDAVIQANLGWSQYKQGAVYAAKSRLQRATELDPEFVPGLVYLARVYLDDRNYADMVPLLETARSKDPENHGVLMNLGIAYRGVDRPEDARATFEKAADLDPRDPSPLYNLAIVYADDLKEYDKAIRHFERYIEAGGEQSDMAADHIVKVERERKKAERQRARREKAAAREADRLERERLLEEQAAQEAAAPSTPAEQDPDQGADDSTDDGAPAESSPWDTEGGGTP